MLFVDTERLLNRGYQGVAGPPLTGTVPTFHHLRVAAPAPRDITSPLADLRIQRHLLQSVVLERLTLRRVRDLFHGAVELAVDNTSGSQFRQFRADTGQAGGVVQHVLLVVSLPLAVNRRRPPVVYFIQVVL